MVGHDMVACLANCSAQLRELAMQFAACEDERLDSGLLVMFKLADQVDSVAEHLRNALIQ